MKDEIYKGCALGTDEIDYKMKQASRRGGVAFSGQAHHVISRTGIPEPLYEFHETCHSVTFYFMQKKTPNDAVTPQRQGQFTPKMKANAVPRLLSSLV